MKKGKVPFNKIVCNNCGEKFHGLTLCQMDRDSILSPEDRQYILSKYLNRDTIDRPWTDLARRIVGKGPAAETDQEWIDARTWKRLPNGDIELQ